MISWKSVKLRGDVIDTSEYVQFKTDNSPEFIIGKIHHQDEHTFVLQNPLICSIFTAVDHEEGISSQQFVAKHYMPFSKDDLVTFRKDLVQSSSDPDMTIVKYYIQYNHNHYHQYEKAIDELIEQIDPVNTKRLLVQKDDPANIHPALVASQESFFFEPEDPSIN